MRQEEEGSGFLSFRTLVTPSVIRIVYMLGAVGICVASVVLLFAPQMILRSAEGDRSNQAAVLLAALLVLVVGNLVWRIFCESILVVYCIHDRLVEISSQLYDASLPIRPAPHALDDDGDPGIPHAER